MAHYTWGMGVKAKEKAILHRKLIEIQGHEASVIVNTFGQFTTTTTLYQDHVATLADIVNNQPA